MGQIAQNSITVEDGNTHCPYKDVNISTLSVNPGTKFWRVEYDWTFQNGNPLSHFGVEYSNPAWPSPGPRNPGPITWDDEGIFNISLTVSTYNALSGGTLISQVTHQAFILIDATCCGTQLLPIPALTGTQTTLSGIYYMSSNLTIPNGHSLIITGTVLVEGDAIPNTGPGGTVGGNFFFVEQGASFEMDGGEVRAHCEQMWGGVEVEQDAKVEMVNSDFKDSFFGIHPQSLSSNPYYADISFSTFKNNRISVVSKDFDGRIGKDYIGHNEFTCNPLEFLSPFMPNTGNNSGETFRSDCHVRLLDGYIIEIGAFENNIFENAINGLELISTPGTSYNPYNYINANTFKNNQKIGLYTNNREGLYIQEAHIFEVPSNPDVTSWQYENYSYLNFPNVEENVVFGIYADYMLEIGFLYGSEIKSDFTNIVDFAGIKRVGIYAGLYRDPTVLNFTHAYIWESHIRDMHVGVNFALVTDRASVKENSFIDNLTSLLFSSNPQGLPGQPGKFDLIDFECNKFDLVNGSADYEFIGLEIVSGCEFNDVGYGGTPTSNHNPGGNGWALDPIQSPGWNDPIPSTPGIGIDVSQWHVYDNWFSIIDDNPSPNWKYARFNNELLGDFDNKVIPASIAFNVSGQNALTTQCPIILEIPFPQSRIANSFLNKSVNEISIHPNPANDHLYISQKLPENFSLELIDLLGTKWSFSKSEIVGNRININHIPKGLYIVELKESNGNISRTRILIQ